MLTGRIDSNFYEIKYDDTYGSFMLEEQILIEEFEEGDPIIFDYYENELGQLIVARMEKAN